MAAKALSFSLFMMLKQGHCSRVIRAPPVKSRVRYRLSATMHNHRTPGKQREGGRIELRCLRNTMALMNNPACLKAEMSVGKTGLLLLGLEIRI